MKELTGVGVALATPLNQDYTVDYNGLERLIEHVLLGRVDYLVVQGTTGESPVFSWKEKLKILDFVIQIAGDRKPVVMGLGGNDTIKLIEQSKDLKGKKISAILSVSPYYSKPSQQGLLRHYTMLADKFPKPIILYNVPSRTGSNLEAETTLELAAHSNILGIKEASGNLDQANKIAAGKPKDFMLISGDDALTLDMISLNSQGVISVLANAIPTAFVDMVRLALLGEFDKASAKNSKLKDAYQLATAEGNPSSIKGALEAIGICNRTVKPPLFDASDDLVSKWKTLLP